MNNNWQKYRHWEGLPENITVPQPPNWLSQLVNRVRSSLINTLVREISLFGQVKHLERCNSLDLNTLVKQTKINDFALIEPLNVAKQSLIETLYGK